jgi:hypothetical protein
MTLRKVLLIAHLYLGATAALVLVIMGLTGALLGVPGRILFSLSSLSLALLAITGLLMGWKKLIRLKMMAVLRGTTS